MKNNIPMNNAKLMDKDKARDYLERIKFLDNHGNRELFESGEIEVYTEYYGAECHIIVHANEKQMIVCDDRAM